MTDIAIAGNVRELQNLIERAVIRSDNEVLPNPLPTSQKNAVTAIAAQSTFRDAERDLILKTLRATGGMVGGPWQQSGQFETR
jgi:formate hydrogenlyase transcriptional activator